MKYKIKAYYNDLGDLFYTPMYKRWFGFYTTLDGYGDPNYSASERAENAIKKHALRKPNSNSKTVYIDVTVNNGVIKMEKNNYEKT